MDSILNFLSNTSVAVFKITHIVYAIDLET